jgi:molecular chaperone GrpE
MNQTEKEEELKEAQAQQAETAQEEQAQNEAQATDEAQAEEAQADGAKAEEALSPEEQLAKDLEEAQAAVADAKDKYLRLSAEFDNYRKRTFKEKAELIKNGAEKTLTAILPVLDDLERAVKTPASEETKAIHEGIELIYNKFVKVLSQEGLQKIETEGQAFDTDFHEAIALIPAQSDDQKNQILDCVQTGYTLNEKVIRHAKVVVAQ